LNQAVTLIQKLDEKWSKNDVSETNNSGSNGIDHDSGSLILTGETPSSTSEI